MLTVHGPYGGWSRVKGEPYSKKDRKIKDEQQRGKYRPSPGVLLEHGEHEPLCYPDDKSPQASQGHQQDSK
ncbi:unnamed protein product [Nezara viridula]|uniref:Uncharacterized protein n=1 Tax=Nezara viridula TaxID=85310 RepID=A0A9P0DZA7_NEZVI|nr:unnamed protein product [Nezara viridula]